ncbi:MAG TPA: CD225/dispanin family protein [Thermoanaerobaculia bacterium]|nr:CD225/dispanin family protein [Thermoanaerobaculia bacterium]
MQQFAAYAAPAAPGSVPNYLVQSILVTLCCCLPAGIVAIVYAAQVNSKLNAGDIAGAEEASRNAKLWSWIGFGVGILVIVIWAVAGGLAGISDAAK